jgi:hypothetical protein
MSAQEHPQVLSGNLLDTRVEMAADSVSRDLTSSRFSIRRLCLGKNLTTSGRHTETVVVNNSSLRV